MKKALFFLFISCLSASGVFAQVKYNAFNIAKLSVSTNTVNTPSLAIDIQIDIPKASLKTDYWLDKSHRPKFRLTYNGDTLKCAPAITFGATDTSVRIVLRNLSQEILDRIGNKDNKVSLQFDTDLVFQYDDNSVTPAVKNKMGKVSMDVLNKQFTDEFTFPADQKTKFVTALNNLYYYKNSIDFGVQPGKDSTSVSYTLNFNFQNIYNSNSLLKCAAPDTKSSGATTLVYYGISSRLSTNTKDSLNFIDIYPLIIHSSNFTGKIPYEWNFKAGHESNETFTNRRFAVDASISTILPNFIDLTSPTYSRLRLKPVVDLGLKGYYDYSSNISAYTSGQAYMNIYYYIPVYDSYAIIVNDKTFYDFSKEKNPGHQLASNYSIAIGTEVPKTGFKVMFKYENGKSDINYKQTQAVVIGLLMNLFNDSPGKKP